MATTTTYVYLCLTLLCASIISPIDCINSEELEQKKYPHKHMFVFGDSLFDAGNNKYLYEHGQVAPGTFWPYGMSNHNRSTGRLSDGLLVPDFIAKFAKMPVLPPFYKPEANFAYGVNFASAGGSVLNGNSHIFMDFRTQRGNFKKYVSKLVKEVGEAEAKKVLKSAVYLFSLGGNDYFGFNTRDPNATQAERLEHVQNVIGNLTLGIKELYGMGLRKIAYQNVGPLGCYSNVRAMEPELKGCVPRYSEHAFMHNQALSKALKNLQTELPGFKYGIFDYYHALEDRIFNPEKYGFKVGTSSCCGSGPYNSARCGRDEDSYICSDPNEYVLFDGNHHTQRTNYQLAQLLWSAAPYVTGPYTAKQLFDLP